MARKGGLSGIGDAMKGYFARAGLKQRVDQGGVIENWGRLVGPQIAKVTTPDRVTQDGVLFVRVVSAAWMQELQLMAPTILARLRERSVTIKDIRYHC